MRKMIIILLLFVLEYTAVNLSSSTQITMPMSADAAILMDKDSERILYQKNINVRFLTASIAKIMTAIVAIENGDVEAYFEVDEVTARQEGSSLYLQKGDKVRLLDLLYGMMLRSGNDAAHLIACNVGRNYDDFLYLMNETAKKIGMINSTFANPTGLDEETANYSTCYDMAKLMAYALDNNLFRKITSTRTYRIITANQQIIDCYNKHHLLHTLDYISGGKTGYTTSAKRTLVTSALKDDLELIAVTMSSNNDDFHVHRRLFEYGFANYQSFLVLKRQVIKVNDVFYQATPVIFEDIKYPVREDEKVECVIKLLKNPGSRLIIGKAVIYLNGKIVKKVDIYRYY
jgi:D-alanyl-D-alanine carboxypeptidase (penicillin-binding protein 5/6)